MSKVAVVILNWNGEGYLRKFLPTLLMHTPSAIADIYIADNASCDGSVDYVKHAHPNIKLILFDENHGFAGGYNRALEKIDADYYILLNSDIEVTANWIRPVIRIMENDLSVAACMPKIKSFSRKEYFEYAGAAGGYIDFLGYPFCRGRLLQTVEKDHGQYDDMKNIFWATGACMFIRGTAFKETGGFDADFFAHMEEIDLCWRLKKKGLKIVYVPDAVVFHVGGGTLPNESPYKLFLNIRNNLFMLFKNLPPAKLLPLVLTRTVLDALMAITYLLQFKPRFTWAVFKAHIAVLINIPTLIKKRERRLTKKKIDGIYPGSIILNYFVKKNKLFSHLPQKNKL